jgi:hypothetical protein
MQRAGSAPRGLFGLRMQQAFGPGTASVSWVRR